MEEESQHPTLTTEIRGFLLVAIAVITWLSLLSYNGGVESRNWLGLFGQYYAFGLLYAFGLASYPISAVVAWIGVREILGRPVEDLPTKAIFFALMMVSFCILSNLVVEMWPTIGAKLQNFIYSQKLIKASFFSKGATRYNLGGVPAYYLLKDLPQANLLRLFSPIGTSLIFGIFFFVSFLLVTQIHFWTLFAKAGHFIERFMNYRRERASKRHDEAPTSLPPKEDSDKSPLLPRIVSYFKVLLPTRKGEKLEDLEFSFTAPPPREEKEEAPFEEDKSSFPIPITRRKVSPRSFNQTPSSPSPMPRTMAEETSEPVKGKTEYSAPSLSLLQNPKEVDQSTLKRFLEEQSAILEETLVSFGIEAKVHDVNAGPTIISYEVIPSKGVKVQKIRSLENDIALKLKAKCIRIIAPIPGRAAVGIEVPNPVPQEVGFKELLSDYKRSNKRLQIPILLGKSVLGEHVISDLAKMPHCIIAGATGSGKSVCINTFIMSIVMNASPDKIRLLLVDPKKVELTPYSRLPHMIAPVVTEPNEALLAMKWLVREMEWRYEVLKRVHARNIIAFNTRRINKKAEAEQDIEIPQSLTYYVCIIDELADLMMVAGNDIEAPIARIAQMARAVGIHLVLATQRPSREVITGLIKANFPTRVAFKVASRVNSQIILDDVGAESLLGNGDMLFLPPGSASPVRAQGAYVRDDDILAVIESIMRKQPTQYLVESFTEQSIATESSRDSSDDLDSLYDDAKSLVIDTGNASTTFLQRKLKIGYARAASIMDQLEEQNIIGKQEGSKPRKVLVRNPNQESS
jgi:S-DNA-T family DNA segregation ATPase FtsK/SpoIIIE